MKEPKVIDSLVSFDEDYSDSHEGTKVVIKKTQHLPEWWIRDRMNEKVNSDHTRLGEFVKFASIPIAVVEQWDREGFKIEEATPAEIVRRLNNLHMDAFVTTRIRV